MIDLITSNFFGENNYSVFTECVSTWVNVICILISPMLLFNLSFCDQPNEDGLCDRKDRVVLRYDHTHISLILTCGLTLVIFVVCAARLPPCYHLLTRSASRSGMTRSSRLFRMLAAHHLHPQR